MATGVGLLSDLTTSNELEWREDKPEHFVATHDGVEIFIELDENNLLHFHLYLENDNGVYSSSFGSYDAGYLADMLRLRYSTLWNPDVDFINFMTEEMKKGVSVEGRQLYRSLFACAIYKKRFEEDKAKKNL